jgi:dienelactone hydrolase
VANTDATSRVAGVAVVVGGAALGVAVVHDGSPGWGALRVALVGVLTVVLARLAGGRTGRLTAALLWTWGAVLFAVGVGLAVPHLTKTGVTVVGLVGGVLLVAGLVLVVGRARSLVGAAPRGWKPPVVLVLLVGLVVSVWSLGQAVAATNVPRTPVGSETPMDRGMPYREVAVEATDGVRLAAWYVPSRNGAAVVLLHGAGSTRSAVLDHAAVLADHGYGVLLLDARGHGRSGGRAMDFGWYGDEDVGGAVSFLTEQPDVAGGRIGVLGLSMGGEEAIGAAGADPRIAAVVAEGATNRVAADKAWLSEEHGWRGSLQQGLDRLTYALTDRLTDASPPVALREAAATAAPTPMLLIAGGAVPDEPPAARHVAGGAAGTVSVWVAPGAAHTGALDRHPREWEERVTSFLAEALSVDPDGGTGSGA